MLEVTDEILWWQWWLLIAITINTIINLIVFFKGRKLHKDKGDINGKPRTK
mgnify:FL=1